MLYHLKNQSKYVYIRIHIHYINIYIQFNYIKWKF